MAGKKGQTTQLQVEVNNEEDWEKLLARDGLILMDVYSEWCGPCVGMIGNLKKAKVEFGGDALHLAIVKCDEIEVLKRFRNKSEPTWLFGAGGMLVNGTLGANAPKLMKMIEKEMGKETRSLKLETFRTVVPFDDYFEEEKERIEAARKLRNDADKLESERKAKELEEKRMRIYNEMADQLVNETVVILFPHTMESEKGSGIAVELDALWRSQSLYVSNQVKMMITREMFDEIFFRGSLEPTDDLMQDLASGPCIVMLLKSQFLGPPGQESEKHRGDLEIEVAQAVYGVEVERDQEIVIPSPKSLPSKFPYIKRTTVIKEEAAGEEEEEEVLEEVTSIPGCWTPSTYLTKCAAIRYLFPARAEKVMTPEEPPIPPKVVMAFDIAKQKDCFELIEEYESDILNYGYFSGTDPATAEHLCATPSQYAKLTHYDSDKFVVVVNKTKSEPLLSFAGLGAAYVSFDDKIGMEEADMFFPPGEEPRFRRLEAAELLMRQAEGEEAPEEEAPEEEDDDEQSEQNEIDLMARLGLFVTTIEIEGVVEETPK